MKPIDRCIHSARSQNITVRPVINAPQSVKLIVDDLPSPDRMGAPLPELVDRSRRRKATDRGLVVGRSPA